MARKRPRGRRPKNFGDERLTQDQGQVGTENTKPCASQTKHHPSEKLSLAQEHQSSKEEPNNKNKKKNKKKQRTNHQKRPQPINLTTAAATDNKLRCNLSHGSSCSKLNLTRQTDNPFRDTSLMNKMNKYTRASRFGVDVWDENSKMPIVPVFPLSNRETWYTLSHGEQPNDLIQRVTTERNKRKEPVLLAYDPKTASNHVKNRVKAAQQWLEKHNPVQFHMQNKLLSWPEIPNPLLKAPGILSDKNQYDFLHDLETNRLANMNSAAGKVIGVHEVWSEIVEYLGYGDIMSLRSTCKLVLQALTVGQIHIDLNPDFAADKVAKKIAAETADRSRISCEIVVCPTRGNSAHTYGAQLYSHFKTYHALDSIAPKLVRLSMRNVKFFDVDILEMMFKSMPQLEKVTITNCEQLGFLKLPSIIKAVATHTILRPDGKKVFRTVDFAPVYYDGPNRADREGSFGAFWNRLPFNFGKSLLSFIKDWYFPAKAVGMNILERGSAFRHWVDRTPYSTDLAIVALHEILEELYSDCRGINDKAQSRVPQRQEIVERARCSMYNAANADEKEQVVVSLKDSLRTWDDEFARAKATDLAAAERKFYNSYFAILTAPDKEPCLIDHRLMNQMCPGIVGRCLPGVLRQDSWIAQIRCNKCDKGAGFDLYQELTALPELTAAAFKAACDRSDLAAYEGSRGTLNLPHGTLESDPTIFDAVSLVIKHRSDFDLARAICRVCLMVEHALGEDGQHHYTHLKRELMSGWKNLTLTAHGNCRTLAHFLGDECGRMIAMELAGEMQTLRDQERGLAFHESITPATAYLDDSYTRIRRIIFPHGPLDREVADVQYPSLGTIEGGSTTGYLPDNFRQIYTPRVPKDMKWLRCMDMQPIYMAAKLRGLSSSDLFKLDANSGRELARYPYVLNELRDGILIGVIEDLLGRRAFRKELLKKIESSVNSSDISLVSAARSSLAHAQMYPNVVAGDWDELRRDYIGYQDYTAEERRDHAQWAQVPLAANNAQIGPRPVVPRATFGPPRFKGPKEDEGWSPLCHHNPGKVTSPPVRGDQENQAETQNETTNTTEQQAVQHVTWASVASHDEIHHAVSDLSLSTQVSTETRSSTSVLASGADFMSSVDNGAGRLEHHKAQSTHGRQQGAKNRGQNRRRKQKKTGTTWTPNNGSQNSGDACTPNNGPQNWGNTWATNNGPQNPQTESSNHGDWSSGPSTPNPGFEW